MDTMIYRCPITGFSYDPLDIQRKLLTSSRGQINRWLELQRGEDELVAMDAEEKILPVVRGAFGLESVDKLTGKGVGTEACLQALNAYLRWVEAKKAKGQTSQPSSPCADCP